MTTPGLFVIRDNIFGYLSYEDMEICCKVSDSWNESLNMESSLKRQSLVKFLLQFGGRYLKLDEKGNEVEIWKKLYKVIPGWNKAVNKIGNKASLDDLKEIKESLQTALQKNKYLKCIFWNPVYDAVYCGDLKLMELFFETSYDMNNSGDVMYGNRNIFMIACMASKRPKGRGTEMVRLIINSAKDHGIDLNMRDIQGNSAFQLACALAPLEVLKLLLENYKELGIDIMHGDNCGLTPLGELELRLDDDDESDSEEWEKFKTILKEEYAKIDSLEQPTA